MHKDFVDIISILSIFDSKPISDAELNFVMSKICKSSNELSRKSKIDEFNSFNKELLTLFKDVLSPVSNCCSNDKCSDCIISKWCNYFRIKQQYHEQNSFGLTFADFFCGAGGLSWGFRRAGYKLSFANDIQECCVETMSLNHPEVPEKFIISADINHVLKILDTCLRYSSTDVVVGGPPCQGFSSANRQRVIDDPRNHLYKCFVKAVEILKPKFFVMENVRGMLSVREQIFQDFTNVGYTTSARILNAKNFGVPQNRERIIFIGNNLGIDNDDIFDKAEFYGTSLGTFVLSDALEHLPPLEAKRTPNSTMFEDDVSGRTFSRYPKNSNEFTTLLNENRCQKVLLNHKARYNNQRDIEIFTRLDPGNNSADPKIADIMPYKNREHIFLDKYYKLDLYKPCKTITAHMKYDCNMYIHPTQARGLTPREAARIQSFPDDYFFRGAYTKTYMQIGNSVPPLLGESIANALKDYI